MAAVAVATSDNKFAEKIEKEPEEDNESNDDNDPAAGDSDINESDSDQDDNGDDAEGDDEVSDNESEAEETSTKLQGTAGMSDVISRILAKPLPSGKVAILSKYKSSERKRLKEEKDKLKLTAEAKVAKLEKNHVLPSKSNAEKEIKLRKIATRGVVKLFNAVTKHQEETKNALKDATTEAKKDQALDSISKSSFLQMLKGGANSKKVKDEPENKVENATDEKPAWAILRDDYMIGAKMKDWNKGEEEVKGESDMDSGNSSDGD